MLLAIVPNDNAILTKGILERCQELVERWQLQACRVASLSETELNQTRCERGTCVCQRDRVRTGQHADDRAECQMWRGDDKFNRRFAQKHVDCTNIQIEVCVFECRGALWLRWRMFDAVAKLHCSRLH